MPQPIAYNRTKNFAAQVGSNTDHPAINAELDNVALTANQLRANLARIQNDDGSLSQVVKSTGLRVDEGVNAKQGIVTLAAQVAAPVQAALATATTGGTLAAATYFYKITALNANGETIGSNEQSIATTGSTSTVTVSWAKAAGAASYRIYRGTAAGAQTVFYAVGDVATFTDTGSAGAAGSVPTANTTGGALVLNTSVTANSRIFLTGQQDGGVPGFVRVSARSVALNFRIVSSSLTDTSIVAYEIFEPTV